jgi:hypothetical protein
MRKRGRGPVRRYCCDQCSWYLQVPVQSIEQTEQLVLNVFQYHNCRDYPRTTTGTGRQDSNRPITRMGVRYKKPRSEAGLTRSGHA